jgi:hypothetical protein
MQRCGSRPDGLEPLYGFDRGRDIRVVRISPG